MIVEREMKPIGVLLPDSVTPSSDEIFRVVKVNDFAIDHIKIKKGDLVAVVGYIHNISYKGEKIILARQQDVIVVLKEAEDGAVVKAVR